MTNWDELRRDLQSINGLRVSQVRAIRDIINNHKAREGRSEAPKFEAKYAGSCAAGADAIEPGDLVRFVEGELSHVGCIPKRRNKNDGTSDEEMGF